MDDAHKAWFLRPEALMSLAHTICDAAAPPLPQYDPDASLAEQAEQVTDWLIDSAYEDAHIRIVIGSAHDTEGKEGFEVYIRLAREPVSDEDDPTVFVGYELFDSDADPDTADGEVTVEIFTPGPWIAHLVRVAERALPIVERRLRDRGEL
jgi:hypothetical protein